MAAIPAHHGVDPETQQKGSYSLGVCIGKQQLAGELDIRLRDFCLLGMGRVPSQGLSALRGGTELLEGTFEVGHRQVLSSLRWERPVGVAPENSYGITLTRTSLQANPEAPRAMRSRARWVRRSPRSSTEGRVYWQHGGTEVYGRLRKLDGVGATEDETLVGACGLRVKKSQHIGPVKGSISGLVETCVTMPALRTEMKGHVTMPSGKGFWEASSTLRSIVPFLLGLQPPADEQYSFGGSEVAGFADEGLLPKKRDDDKPLPALATASVSLARLAPLTHAIGIFAFVDAGAASGAGEVGNELIPIHKRQQAGTSLFPAGMSRWSTDLVASAGVGVYLRSAPQMRIGMAWPLNKELQDHPGRQRFFMKAQGTM